MPTSLAQSRAYTYLSGVVKEHRRSGRARLPSHRQLSAAAGVSPVTLLRALARLKQEGTVMAAPGSGIHVRGVVDRQHGCPQEPEPAQTEARREPRWRRTRAQIQSDILNGLYEPGALLPASKELLRRYGVCYRTLNKALQSLADRHAVEQANRRYRVPGWATPHRGGAVVLLAAGYPTGSLHHFSARTREFLTALESECARSRAGLAVSPFELPPGADGRVRISPNFSKAAGSALGFVVFQHGMGAPALADLVHRTAAYGKPVAVLDEGIGFRLAPSYCRANLVRIFSIAFSPAAGAHIGRYLLSLGHRAAAFISVYRDSPWSRNRYLGLRSAFVGATGEPGSVVAFESAEPPPTSREVERQEVSARSEEMELLVRLRHIAAVRNQAELLLRRELTRPLLVPLLGQAIERRELTAWVAVNDDIALECLDFLSARGVGVPEDVSVIGFDDNVDALARRLTSYNFNCAAATHALLCHVFDPHQVDTFGGSYEPVEIEGFISHKGTVGQRRGSTSLTPRLTRG